MPRGAGKTVFNTRAYPSDVSDLEGLRNRLSLTSHRIDGLEVEEKEVPQEGSDGLSITHYKPMSWPEFKSRLEWNRFQQKKFVEKGIENHVFSDETDRLSVEEQIWRELAFGATGATHTTILFHLPRLCQTYSTFKEAMGKCSLDEALCHDCLSLRRHHGCPDIHHGETIGPLPLTKHLMGSARVFVTGQGSSTVQNKLDLDKSLRLVTEFTVATDVSQAVKSRLPIVHTDTSPAICQLPCDRTIYVHPTRTSDVLSSLVAIWLGPLIDRFPVPFT
jgi:hypothetical protein